MNSHYYSPRFDKVPNKFKKETIGKLSFINEARVNKENLVLKEKEYYQEPNFLLGGEVTEMQKYDIDTRNMDYESRKMFMSIEYGNKKW